MCNIGVPESSTPYCGAGGGARIGFDKRTTVFIPAFLFTYFFDEIIFDKRSFYLIYKSLESNPYTNYELEC